jgi:hypothetical protein
MRAKPVEVAKSTVARVDRALPESGEWPIGRIVLARLATYAVLVTVLVLLHPVHPWSMAFTGAVLIVLVVAAQHRWRLPPPEGWDTTEARRAALIAGLLAVGGAMFVVVGLDDAVPREQQSIHAGLLFMGIASAFLGAGLLESILRRKGGHWYLVAAAGLGVAVTAYVLGIVFLGRGWWTWLPLVAVLVAPVFVGICSEWVIRASAPAWRPLPVGRRPVLAAVAGAIVVLLTLRAFGALEWWAVWWLVPVVPAIALVVARLRGQRRLDRVSIGVLAGAAVLAGVPVVLMEVTGFPAHLIWLFTVLALLVWFIAVDSEIDVLFLVVLAAVVWSGLPRSVPLTEVARVEPGQPALVALGDSFISGEGAQTFFEGTNVRLRNECRRAPTAYPVLLATGADAREAIGSLIFLACSGARADEVVSRPQYPDEPVGGPDVLQADGTWRPGRSQLDQLAQILEEYQPQPAVVLVSIGGNDAGFGTIARTCFAPGACHDLAERWLVPLFDPDGGLPDRLDHAYDAIADVAGEAPVVVVPYPIPLAPASCEASTLSDAEHRFLHDFTVALNATIEAAAARAGFQFADDVATALLESGGALCGGADPGVNWVDLNPVGGSLSQTANPRNWLHNSLHPNARGHATIASALGEWLDDHLADEAPEPDPDQQFACHGPAADPRCPELAPPTGPVPDACLEERPDDPDACERAWMLDQFRRVAPAASFAVGLLVLAQWLVGVQLIAWWRAGRDQR